MDAMDAAVEEAAALPPMEMVEVDHWDEDRLAAHFDELLREAEERGDDIIEVPASKRARVATGPRAKKSTSLFNDSTVWFGKTPIVLRADLAAP